MTDWSQIRFLESPANLRRVLKKATDREPSARDALGAAVCLQQGRFFYEAAAEAPLEIRPLLIFYGMVNFSKALTIGRAQRGLEELPQQHGLRDISAQNATLDQLTVKVEAKGTFQDFNNTIRQTDGVRFYRSSMSDRVFIPTSASPSLEGKTVSLKTMLSRIPGLAQRYRDTFEEEPGAVDCSISYYDEEAGITELRIDEPEVFRTKGERTAMIDGLTQRFPCLRNWRLCHAKPAWDKSVLTFVNLDKDIAEQVPSSEDDDGSLELNWRGRKDLKGSISKPFWEILDPVAGGVFYGLPSLISPISGVYISELSLHYMAMYLLSSLVRYRPDIWARSISRLRIAGEDADDRTLALIVQLITLSFDLFPDTVAKVLSLHLTAQERRRLDQQADGA